MSCFILKFILSNEGLFYLNILSNFLKDTKCIYIQIYILLLGIYGAYRVIIVLSIKFIA